MNNNVVLEITISARVRVCPCVHMNLGRLAVGRGSEVGVVGPRSVLSIELNAVVAFSTFVAIVVLEVVRGFVKSVSIL
jgi:hypothetical protein